MQKLKTDKVKIEESIKAETLEFEESNKIQEPSQNLLKDEANSQISADIKEENIKSEKDIEIAEENVKTAQKNVEKVEEDGNAQKVVEEDENAQKVVEED